MVVVHLAQFVKVVDHEPCRLAHAMGRTVSQPVEPLDPRAVGQVKVCHRVERARARLASSR